jgi:hypothetical protein
MLADFRGVIAANFLFADNPLRIPPTQPIGRFPWQNGPEGATPQLKPGYRRFESLKIRMT